MFREHSFKDRKGKIMHWQSGLLCTFRSGCLPKYIYINTYVSGFWNNYICYLSLFNRIFYPNYM